MVAHLRIANEHQQVYCNVQCRFDSLPCIFYGAIMSSYVGLIVEVERVSRLYLCASTAVGAVPGINSWFAVVFFSYETN